MPDIEPQDELSSSPVRNFFMPGIAEVFLYLIISMVLLLLLNAGSIINTLTNNFIGDPQNLKANFTTFFDGFSNSFSSALGGRLGQIMLWSVVGAFAYMGIWLAKNVLNSFENDIIADHYLHPSSYNRLGYWGSSFSVKIFLAAMILITAGYIFVAVTAVLPAVAALAGSAVYNFHGLSSVLYIIFSVVGVALVLYIAVILFKLISHLWKLL